MMIQCVCIVKHHVYTFPIVLYNMMQLSLLLLQGLQAARVSCSFHEIPNEDHFSVVERLIESEYSLTKLILGVINSVA